MNLNIIEACKKVDEYIKELPEDFKQPMWELFNHMKKGAMLSRIRATCNDEDITKVLSEEYLRMNSSGLMKDLMIIMSDKEKGNPLENPLEGLYENFKEIYEKNADKIAACRAELGLPNPFSEFKPYDE